MDLIQMLTSQLNVDESQAKGGAGLILKAAKDKLGGGDFGKLAAQLPNADALMQAAPSAGGLGGLVSGLSGKLGGLGGLGALAGLAGGFEKLGLKPEMVGKFAPVMMDFFKSKGGQGLVQEGHGLARRFSRETDALL